MIITVKKIGDQGCISIELKHEMTSYEVANRSEFASFLYWVVRALGISVSVWWLRLEREAVLELGEFTIPVLVGDDDQIPEILDKAYVQSVDGIGQGGSMSAFLPTGNPYSLSIIIWCALLSEFYEALRSVPGVQLIGVLDGD